MTRFINTETAGKERQRLSQAVVVALRELAQQGEADLKTRDLVAFIVLALESIAGTIDPSVAAWEKRGYWVKADRFRLEWEWAAILKEKLHRAILEGDWSKVALASAQVADRLSTIKVSQRHRLGTPWQGAFQKLIARSPVTPSSRSADT